jgi:hypothetical protein
MTEYILEHEKGVIIATYSKGGRLKKLDAKRGFLVDAKGHTFAQEEKDIEAEYWKPYQKQKDAFFNPALKKWNDFFYKRSGFKYRFGTADGGALKSIGQYLTEVSCNTEAALDVWRYVLENWETLPDFYRNKPELKFINSQINTILNLLKNGKQTGKGSANANADALRQR